MGMDRDVSEGALTRPGPNDGMQRTRTSAFLMHVEWALAADASVRRYTASYINAD